MSLPRRMALAFQHSSPLPYGVRRLILQFCGLAVEKGVCVEAGGRFACPKVSIGAASYVNFDLLVDGLAPVAIGRNVRIGPGVKILTGTHEITGDPRARASRVAVHRPVRIGDGVWLGANVVVLPGVTVAEGCVVAAGAVVTRSTEANGLYAGVPARRLRELATDAAPLAFGRIG